jgi:hypothetical protein
MELDPTIFLNYGIAGLILLVFYLLFREYSKQLDELKDAIVQLKVTQEKLVTLLDVLLKKLLGEGENK